MSDFTQAVDLAYHCTLFLVDPDVSREVAENAIDNAPKVRTGMSFAVRAAVLERFEPAERDPIPFVDYLPEPFAKVSNARVDEMLEHLNSFVAHEYEHGTDLVNGHVVRFADRTGVLDEGFAGAFDWLALQPESAVLTNDKDCHEAELKDGTVLFWEPSEKQWTVAAMDAPPEGSAVRAQEILDELNAFANNKVRYAGSHLHYAIEWAKSAEGVASVYGPGPEGTQVRLADGAVIVWYPGDIRRWEFAAMDTVPAEFVPEHGEAVLS